jgi:hypothetical protein
VRRAAWWVAVLVAGCGAEPARPPVVVAPAVAPPADAAVASDDDAPGTCGSQVCGADQLCEDLYKGHAVDARGRPLDRKKCVPLPEACKATPTCACVTQQLASTHCTDAGGHVYVNDYPRRPR